MLIPGVMKTVIIVAAVHQIKPKQGNFCSCRVSVQSKSVGIYALRHIRTLMSKPRHKHCSYIQ